MRTAATAMVLLAALITAGGSLAGKIPLSTPLTSAGFEKIEHRHGVTVYGHRQSQTLHFAAESRFVEPPRQVQRFLLAYEQQVGQIGRLSESRILRRRPGALVVYQRLNLPVIDDRDYTLQVRWGQQGELLWVTFAVMRGGPAARQGVVRVRVHSGSWQLRPINGGRATFARYQMQIDLGGWVPMWMVRRSAGKEMAQVFAEFSRMMAAERKRGLPGSGGRRGSSKTPGGADRPRAGNQ